MDAPCHLCLSIRMKDERIHEFWRCCYSFSTMPLFDRARRENTTTAISAVPFLAMPHPTAGFLGSQHSCPKLQDFILWEEAEDACVDSANDPADPPLPKTDARTSAWSLPGTSITLESLLRCVTLTIFFDKLAFYSARLSRMNRSIHWKPRLVEWWILTRIVDWPPDSRPLH